MNKEEFTTKDSGKREWFNTWMVRDTQEWKPRIDLISPFFLERVWHLLARGAVKYEPRNWEKGCEYSRITASMMRHANQWMMWDKSEDHLSAICINAMMIIHHQELGRTDLDDMPIYEKQEVL